jgi:two-component system response regulator (stage 0 sporulation protein A)
MKKKISVLLVDDNIEFGDLLNEHISKYEDIHIIGIARDGIEAMEMIDIFKPDVVLLDIIMPNLDGIGVLEKFTRRRNETRPMFIILSAIGQDVFIKKAISLGAEYYIVKPFDVGILVSRIRQMFTEKYIPPISSGGSGETEPESITREEPGPDNTLEIAITSMILDAGIPPHITGYRYIREAIIQVLSGDFRIFNSITKVIYPAVAKKFNTTPRKVERSIRNAIDSAWDRMKQNRQDMTNNSDIYWCKKTKPTNSEFIATLADRVRVNLGLK